MYQCNFSPPAENSIRNWFFFWVFSSSDSMTNEWFMTKKKREKRKKMVLKKRNHGADSDLPWNIRFNYLLHSSRIVHVTIANAPKKVQEFFFVLFKQKKSKWWCLCTCLSIKWMIQMKVALLFETMYVLKRYMGKHGELSKRWHFVFLFSSSSIPMRHHFSYTIQSWSGWLWNNCFERWRKKKLKRQNELNGKQRSHRKKKNYKKCILMKMMWKRRNEIEKGHNHTKKEQKVRKNWWFLYYLNQQYKVYSKCI